jgi:hypothetical protein
LEETDASAKHHQGIFQDIPFDFGCVDRVIPLPVAGVGTGNRRSDHEYPAFGFLKEYQRSVKQYHSRQPRTANRGA